jgi:hypothetical protein
MIKMNNYKITPWVTWLDEDTYIAIIQDKTDLNGSVRITIPAENTSGKVLHLAVKHFSCAFPLQIGPITEKDIRPRDVDPFFADSLQWPDLHPPITEDLIQAFNAKLDKAKTFLEGQPLPIMRAQVRTQIQANCLLPQVAQHVIGFLQREDCYGKTTASATIDALPHGIEVRIRLFADSWDKVRDPMSIINPVEYTASCQWDASKKEWQIDNLRAWRDNDKYTIMHEGQLIIKEIFQEEEAIIEAVNTALRENTRAIFEQEETLAKLAIASEKADLTYQRIQTEQAIIELEGFVENLTVPVRKEAALTR